jgi:hypothetical protein
VHIVASLLDINAAEQLRSLTQRGRISNDTNVNSRMRETSEMEENGRTTTLAVNAQKVDIVAYASVDDEQTNLLTVFEGLGGKHTATLSLRRPRTRLIGGMTYG